jgi:hypothetical protein
VASVVDIRGQRALPEIDQVLVDPSGVRARRLARCGRVVALVLLTWIAGLGLAGLGVLPADDLPLGGVLSGAAPAALRSPAPATRSDPAAREASPAADHGGRASGLLLPAGSAKGRSGAASAAHGHHGLVVGRGPSGGSGAVGRVPGASGGGVSGSGGSAGPGQAGTTPIGPAGGVSATPPGASHGAAHPSGRGTLTAPGQVVKSTTPGHTNTTGRSSSGAAPGRVKRSATTAAITLATGVPTLPGHRGGSGGHANSS